VWLGFYDGCSWFHVSGGEYDDGALKERAEMPAGTATKASIPIREKYT
jgi:hypothetical protein